MIANASDLLTAWFEALDVTGALFHLAVSLVILCVIFVPLEKAFPARADQRSWRPHVVTDGLFLAGQYLFFVAAATAMLQWIQPWTLHLLPEAIRAPFGRLPFVLQAVVVVVAADVAVYWGHRAQHSFDILWRFHAVHHSAEHLDWVAAHREHPVDGLITMALVNLPAFLLGFPIEGIAAYLVVRGMWSIFIHSNVRLPLGPLGLLFGDPALHHWHHAQSDRMNHNYANVAPYLDVIFGTHYRPDGDETYALGLREWWPAGYFAQLWWPLVRPTPPHAAAQPAPPTRSSLLRSSSIAASASGPLGSNDF